MTEPRLKTGLWARSILRTVALSGCSAMVLRKGDEDAGAVLIVLMDRQRKAAVLRESTTEGQWDRVLMPDAQSLDDYLRRQQRYDPDLWILELEVESVETPLETTLTSRRG